MAVIIGTPFKSLANASAKARGLPGIAAVALPQPVLTGETQDFRPCVDDAIDEIIFALTKWQSPQSKTAKADTSFVFEGADYEEALGNMNDGFMARRMGDGFPLVPPTKERVEWMLSGTNLDPEEVVASYENLYHPITVRIIAINAVMAGARPEYMPVIIAALKAISRTRQPHFLFGSAGMFAPVIMLNGPIAKEIGVNYGVGLMGPGFRANATIGRAVNLIFTNGVGQVPGDQGFSGHSMPGRYSWCFAENEEASPWEPFHVDQGFPADANVVSVVSARGSQTLMVESPASNVAAAIAHAVSGCTVGIYSMAYCQLVVLGPSHAKMLASEGWKKKDIQRYVYENARIPKWKAESMGLRLKEPEKWQTVTSDETMVSMLRGPEHLVVKVAGIPGTHFSTFIPGIDRIAVEDIEKYKPKAWDRLLQAGRARAQF
ncbi:MAG: hypothetical protein HYX83_00815 [Chloroflexi bacterium]|nr:hypothetical protein [Chloroflexota bacterium]